MTKHFRRACTAVAVGLLAVTAARAEEVGKAPVHFVVEAQPLRVALNEWAAQAGLSVIWPTDQTKSMRMSPRVEGELAPEEALRRLLENSGLSYTFVDGQTVAIHAVKTGMDAGGVDRTRLARADVPPSQNNDGTTPAAAAEEKVGEIIVTAQKRAERLLDVPQSVSVLTSDALSKLGATQFRDFASTIPGLTFFTAGAGNTQISLRGVTVGFDISPTVGVYVDEVPYGAVGRDGGRSVQQALDLGVFDIDRIEVLRGPQGTLYGASSMGGLLKYVTKRPDPSSFGANVQTGVSTTQDGGISYNLAGMVNMPLVADKLALRANAFQSHDGGYIDNVALGREDVNRSDVYGGRLDFLFTPTDALSIRLTGLAQNIARDGEATADYTFAGAAPFGELEQNRNIAEPFDQRFRLVSGTVTLDLGAAELTSVSSFQRVRTEQVRDLTVAYGPFCRFSAVGACRGLGQRDADDLDRFTQEVRVAGGQGKRIEWVFGGYYSHENGSRDVPFVLLNLAGQPATNDLFAYEASRRFEEYAAFGSVTWRLSDRFDVSGGARYADYTSKSASVQTGAFGAATTSLEGSSGAITYLANARYHFTERSTGYARYATGYRPMSSNPPGVPQVKSDQTKNYELGWKAETPGGRFGIDVAGYYIDWVDMPVNIIVNGLGAAVNTGGATIRGSELTLTSRLASFTVTGAFAYQDAKLSKADPSLGAAKDERLPNVPRFTAALSADYLLPLGQWQPTVGATLRHVGQRMASFDRSTSYRQYDLGDYTVLDLRTAWTFGPLDAQLYVRNVFDGHGELAAFNWRGVAMPALLQPRTIGLSLSRQF